MVDNVDLVGQVLQAVWMYNGRLPACRLLLYFPGIRKELGDCKVAEFVKRNPGKFDLVGPDSNLVIVALVKPQCDGEVVVINASMQNEARGNLRGNVEKIMLEKCWVDGQVKPIKASFLWKEKKISNSLARYVWACPKAELFQHYQEGGKFKNEKQAWWSTQANHLLDFLITEGYQVTNTSCSEHDHCACFAEVLPSSQLQNRDQTIHIDYLDEQLTTHITTFLLKSKPTFTLPISMLGSDQHIKKYLSGRSLLLWLQGKHDRFILKEHDNHVYFLSLDSSYISKECSAHEEKPKKKSKKKKAEFVNPDDLRFLGKGTGVVVLSKPYNVTTEAMVGAFTCFQRDAFASEYGIAENRFDDDQQELFLRLYQPVSVSRLDKATSGCLVVGVGLPGGDHLTDQFKGRTVRKEYLCLVAGSLNEPGEVTSRLKITTSGQQFQAFVSPHGKDSHTVYQPVGVYRPPGSEECFTLVKVEPKTGRTHQIRCHMASIGHPLVGDWKYGRKVAKQSEEWCPRLFLHCGMMGVLDLDGQRVTV